MRWRFNPFPVPFLCTYVLLITFRSDSENAALTGC
jgi:hypothetical protein